MNNAEKWRRRDTTMGNEHDEIMAAPVNVFALANQS